MLKIKKKNKGLFTYYVSQIQGFLDPPSPLRQQWSAFGFEKYLILPDCRAESYFRNDDDSDDDDDDEDDGDDGGGDEGESESHN